MCLEDRKVETSAYRFFRANAGYRIGFSAADAFELALAEKEAHERGWFFTWEGDPEPYELGECETEMPNEVYGCVLRDHDGDMLESLWSIGDPSHQYVRVVQAELALEALYRLRQAEIANRNAHTFQAL